MSEGQWGGSEAEWQLLVSAADLGSEIWAEINQMMGMVSEDLSGRMTMRDSQSIGALCHLMHFSKSQFDIARLGQSILLQYLIARNFYESWCAGIILLNGDDSDIRRWVANAKKGDRAEIASYKDLRRKGALEGVPVPSAGFEEGSDWGFDLSSVVPQRWSFEEMMDRAIEIAEAEDIAIRGEAMYGYLYRKLSNRMGVHASPYLFQRYLQTKGEVASFSVTPYEYAQEGEGGYSQRIKSYWASVEGTAVYAYAVGKRYNVELSGLDRLASRMYAMRDEIIKRLAVQKSGD
jgi:hypothetical protein